MAKLKTSEVTHVAKLSQLTLNKSQTKKFQTQLSEVLDYFKALSKVNTDHIAPSATVTGLININRADKLASDPTLSQDQALSGTAQTHNGYFVVNALLQNKDE